MIKAIINRFKDDRKYFTIVFFILFLLVLSGLVSPYLIQQEKENWSDILSEKILEIEKAALSDFNDIETHLISSSKSVKTELKKVLSSNNISYGNLVKTINHSKYEDLSLEILAPNGKLIAWNSLIAVPQEAVFPFEYPIGETYFFNSDLVSYLTVIDTLISETDVFYLIVSMPFEKHYVLRNEHYKEIKFSKNISDENSVQAEISFNPFESKTKDGRKYSFDLLNNRNNKIGQVTITKPILDVAINQVSYHVELIQSFLVFLAITFFGLGLRNEFNQLKSSVYKIILIIIYLSAFRYLIYQVGFPANLFSGSLSDPSFFSSAFAGGVVRSPIEFLITVIFFSLLCVKIYQYSINYVFSSEFQQKKIKGLSLILIFIPLVLIFFLGFRGLSASLRSVIFDSTIRYFRGAVFLSDLPSLIMNLNVLLLGSSVILLLNAIIIFLFAVLKADKNHFLKYWLMLFLFFEGSAIIYIIIQKLPLISYALIIFIIMLIFILSYFTYVKFKKSKYVFIYAALLGSIISILMLNYFNLELERESLKITAAEINRPNDNLFKFMISEVLINSMRDERISSTFTSKETNFNSEAYILWCKSSLQREAINSRISFLDKKGNLLGQFWTGAENIIEDYKPTIMLIKKDPVVYSTDNINGTNRKTLTGLAPIIIQNETLGYISVSILWNPDFPGITVTPEFVRSNRDALNSVLDFSQLKIFEFRNSKLVNVYGDIYPSRDQILPIVNADFSNNFDAWLTLNLNEEKYLTYAFKNEIDDDIKITSVSIVEKKFSWNIFNFFKLFIVQVIFIVVFFIALFTSDIKNFRYTFRFQLTIAFLLISLIPVIILALYNRQLVEKRVEQAILNELKERLSYVENYINSKFHGNKEKDLTALFASAYGDLKIAFAVYDNTFQTFNSNDQYYKAGIFSKRINPQIYYNLYYLSFREYGIKEHVENYSFNSFYKKISLGDKSFILSANDIFNQVDLTFSTSDLDVLIFGIYLFAAIVIILLSTFLADKISLPIRRLTKATASVAQGDLNISLANKEKGELKDLFDGFNQMTNELRKNQSELAQLERENAWKEMAKQVAHEIKNPLTPMKLSIQQLMASFKEQNKKFDEIFDKVSITILNQIESLSMIASEFSRFAKMPSYKIENVDLGKAASEVMTLFTDEKININLELAENLPMVSADSSHTRRLMINLIRNSIQADASEIKLKIYREDSACLLIVEDNGKGIASENKEKIFEQNFTTKQYGMGLGLKLIKRFLDGIGGSIQLLNSDNQGTIFKISFPIAQN